MNFPVTYGTSLWYFGCVHKSSGTLWERIELTQWFSLYVIKLPWYFLSYFTLFVSPVFVRYGWYQLIQLFFNFPQQTPAVCLVLSVQLDWDLALLPGRLLILDTFIFLSCTHNRKSFLEVNGLWSSYCPLDILSDNLRTHIFYCQHGGLNHNSASRRFHLHGSFLLRNL